MLSQKQLGMDIVYSRETKTQASVYTSSSFHSISTIDLSNQETNSNTEENKETCTVLPQNKITFPSQETSNTNDVDSDLNQSTDVGLAQEMLQKVKSDLTDKDKMDMKVNNGNTKRAENVEVLEELQQRISGLEKENKELKVLTCSNHLRDAVNAAQMD